MKRKHMIVFVILLLIFAGNEGVRWHMAMRPAYKYLDMLESNDPKTIVDAACLLRGSKKVVRSDGRPDMMHIAAHRPLHGIAAKSVKAKILELLQTSENWEVRDSLLWATQGETGYYTGIYYEGNDFDILAKVIQKQNIGMSNGEWTITKDDQGNNIGIFRARISR